MNPKLQKVLSEIDKTKNKIAAQQTRLRELEQQKTEKSYLLDSMSEEVRRQISACQQMETIQEDE